MKSANLSQYVQSDHDIIIILKYSQHHKHVQMCHYKDNVIVRAILCYAETSTAKTMLVGQ